MFHSQVNNSTNKSHNYCSNLGQVVITRWGMTQVVTANCAFSHYNKDAEPRRDEETSGKGYGRTWVEVIPSITTSKGARRRRHRGSSKQGLPLAPCTYPWEESALSGAEGSRFGHVFYSKGKNERPHKGNVCVCERVYSKLCFGKNMQKKNSALTTIPVFRGKTQTK